MTTNFLHGVEVINIDDGARPIQTTNASIIGLVGTAPDADATKFPLNTPVLVTSRTEAALLGADGTLPDAIDGIYDQIGAATIIIRVEEGETASDTLSNVIGGVDGDGNRQGLQVLLDAKSVLGYQPRLLIAPQFSHELACATEMDAIADRLRAVAIIDGPNTTDAAAIAYRQNFGSKRIFLIDPWVKILKDGVEEIEPASARVAGMIVHSDLNRGFWWSPSNTIMNGIIGTARPIDYVQGDVNARANLLNENQVTTIIQQEGYRLWGNRTTSSDAKWAFLSVVRTADIISDSILAAHLWAVDRNITKNYVSDVVEGVNNYLRTLRNLGAIIGGQCWADPDLNTPDNIAKGQIYFNFDFTAPSPAERITFQAMMTDDYNISIV